MMFIADKKSLREALRSNDLQAGTKMLHMMDSTVKNNLRRLLIGAKRFYNTCRVTT